MILCKRVQKKDQTCGEGGEELAHCPERVWGGEGGCS